MRGTCITNYSTPTKTTVALLRMIVGRLLSFIETVPSWGTCYFLEEVYGMFHLPFSSFLHLRVENLFKVLDLPMENWRFVWMLRKKSWGWLQIRDLGKVETLVGRISPLRLQHLQLYKVGVHSMEGGEPFVKKHHGIAKPLLRSTHFTCYFEGYHLLCNAGNLRGSC